MKIALTFEIAWRSQPTPSEAPAPANTSATELRDVIQQAYKQTRALDVRLRQVEEEQRSQRAAKESKAPVLAAQPTVVAAEVVPTGGPKGDPAKSIGAAFMGYEDDGTVQK